MLFFNHADSFSVIFFSKASLYFNRRSNWKTSTMLWLNNLMFLTTFTSNISVSLTVSSQYGRQLQTLIKIVRTYYFNPVFIRLLLRFIRVLLLFHRIIPKIFKFIVPNEIKRSVIFSPLWSTNQTANGNL